MDLLDDDDRALIAEASVAMEMRLARESGSAVDLLTLRLGKLERSPGKNDNWVESNGGLPRYIEKITDSLHRKRGFTISRAIATAVSMVKRWARGGENVNPDTRVKAAAALAQWTALKAKAKAKRAAK